MSDAWRFTKRHTTQLPYIYQQQLKPQKRQLLRSVGANFACGRRTFIVEEKLTWRSKIELWHETNWKQNNISAKQVFETSILWSIYSTSFVQFLTQIVVEWSRVTFLVFHSSELWVVKHEYLTILFRFINFAFHLKT